MEQARGNFAVHVRSRLSGRVWTVQPGVAVDLRRDPDADIPLEHPSVQQEGHALLEWVDDQPMLVAVGAAGVYVDGTRVSRLALRSQTVIRVGDPVLGEDLDLIPVPAAVQAFDSDVSYDVEDEGVTVNRRRLAGGPAPPVQRQIGTGGLDRAGFSFTVTPGSTPPPALTDTPAGVSVPLRVGPALTVAVEGRSKTLTGAAGRTYTIGRSTSSDVIIADPAVSRRHLRVFWNGVCWHVTDVSSHGTFRMGRPPTRLPSGVPCSFSGRLELRLGNATAGQPLVLEVATSTSRFSRWRNRSR